MPYTIIPVTPFQQNCTLLWCEHTQRGVVIDPGGEPDRILLAAAQQQVKLEKILLTHGHLDHAGAATELAQRLQLPIVGPHSGDKFWLDLIPQQSQMFGFRGQAVQPDQWLTQGDTVSFGEVTLEVYHCPGHTPGHVVFFDRTARLAQVGDVLFHGSIGRTDFPGGNHETLLASIRDKLWPLGDDVTFIPGHGPISTFGVERRTNPFLAGRWR